MKRLRLLIRTYFGFSRTETNAFILFIPLIGVILFSEPLYRKLKPEDPDFFANISKTDSLYALFAQADSSRRTEKKVDTVIFHPFDPNIAEESELIALDLPKNLASRVVRYRDKGGAFRKKEDLLRIFGMDTAWYRKAEPWIRLKAFKRELTAYKARVQEKERFDINTADSIQLDAVYGVGPVLARRIIQFRDRLGGFISMDQLSEVYGLDSTVVKNLKGRFEIRNGFKPRMMPLNEVSLEVLIAHPYVSRREAQAIISYRTQHGGFDSVGQLKEIKLIDAKWMDRMKAYLQGGGTPAK